MHFSVLRQSLLYTSYNLCVITYLSRAIVLVLLLAKSIVSIVRYCDHTRTNNSGDFFASLTQYVMPK